MSENKHNILLSIGCNKDCEKQMAIVRERLSMSFPDIAFTDIITTPAYGKSSTTPPYANMLAKTTTRYSEKELSTFLKATEKELGDTEQLRKQHDIVMMDIDILKYDNIKKHEEDWLRSYIIELLKKPFKFNSQSCNLAYLCITVIIALLIGSSTMTYAQTKDDDTELLGRAVEYYQGGKYHECIIAFTKLQQRYKLNPRFMAYLGFSCYKEGMYEEAVKHLKQGIPELAGYPPKELAVYNYSCAESLFTMKKYDEAITYYNQALPHTEGNDKADILFHTAFSYFFQNDTISAVSYFDEALDLYKQNIISTDRLHNARMRQTATMLKAMHKNN